LYVVGDWLQFATSESVLPTAGVAVVPDSVQTGTGPLAPLLPCHVSVSDAGTPAPAPLEPVTVYVTAPAAVDVAWQVPVVLVQPTQL
jgi:hypothetical protein